MIASNIKHVIESVRKAVYLSGREAITSLECHFIQYAIIDAGAGDVILLRDKHDE